MQRALDELERAARNESERARQNFDAQQAAEAALSVKFKGIVSDLRKSWEEEEIARARQLEERLRAHYSTVLEHMEAQLQMALQLQDEADKQWMEDVEARNRQQVESLRRFEDKCRRLYDTRLKEYCEKTDQQMTQYEEQLLQVGSTLAIERGRVEGRQRRMKLACHKWKVEYQKEVDARYREMAASLEGKYMDEVHSLLEENARLKMGINIQDADNKISTLGLMPAAEMRLFIQRTAAENNISADDVANLLGTLLDAAPCNALMQAEYERLLMLINSKSALSSLQIKSRKEALDHKRQKGGGVDATLPHPVPAPVSVPNHVSTLLASSTSKPSNPRQISTGPTSALKLTKPR
jgi:hypothetical protein